MVTKGLDFDHVSLVGVFNADRMMHFPDFRSYERAYQLITQVSGRAGRREKPGTVVIQTSNPEHPVLNYILQHNFHEFYTTQLADRQEHGYPPFSRLISITVKHIDKKICNELSQTLADTLRIKLKTVRVHGPGEPMVSKIRNQFLMTMLIKIPRAAADLAGIKSSIQEMANNLQKEKIYRSSRIVIDVDPV